MDLTTFIMFHIFLTFTFILYFYFFRPAAAAKRGRRPPFIWGSLRVPRRSEIAHPLSSDPAGAPEVLRRRPWSPRAGKFLSLNICDI